jgi:hypothetical protein
MIFKKADLVVGTFSSNFGRLVYELMHIEHPNPFVKFISLDKPYFIYGYSNISSNRDEY